MLWCKLLSWVSELWLSINHCCPAFITQTFTWECYLNHGAIREVKTKENYETVFTTLLAFWKDNKVRAHACLCWKNSSIIHSLSPQTTKYSCVCVFVCLFFSGLAGILIKHYCDVAPHHCAAPLAPRKLSVWAAVPLSFSGKTREGCWSVYFERTSVFFFNSQRQ